MPAMDLCSRTVLHIRICWREGDVELFVVCFWSTLSGCLHTALHSCVMLRKSFVSNLTGLELVQGAHLAVRTMRRCGQ
jgi:hypothetical protein